MAVATTTTIPSISHTYTFSNICILITNLKKRKKIFVACVTVIILLFRHGAIARAAVCTARYTTMATLTLRDGRKLGYREYAYLPWIMQ